VKWLGIWPARQLLTWVMQPTLLESLPENMDAIIRCAAQIFKPAQISPGKKVVSKK
jgi:hypothetical protein